MFIKKIVSAQMITSLEGDIKLLPLCTALVFKGTVKNPLHLKFEMRR